MIQIENIDEIYKWDIQELWNAFQHIESEPIYDKEFHQVKYGIKIKIHINYFINELYKIYTDGKNVKFIPYDPISIIDFWEELDKRKYIMREIILEELSRDERPTIART